MARLIWTEPALQELDEIADYISLDNATAAKNLVQDVFDRVELLSSHPMIGKKVEEIALLNYRELVFQPCRVFYRIDHELIYVIHVLRTEQLFHIDTLKSR
ncbi:MAG: type II toxin-antitoxin system RelE/ParE family toxin [Bacteroidota bacterium]